MNRVPGFTAEVSLDQKTGSYGKGKVVAVRFNPSGELAPALGLGDRCSYCVGHCAAYCVSHPGSVQCQACMNICGHICP